MFADAIGAEFRRFEDREYQGKPARVVVAERTYPTSADDLWNALTDPERIPRWFLPIEGELKLGGRYQLKGNAGGVINRCDPPHALDVTWEFAGAVSWVTLRIAPEGKKARLTLEHIMHAGDPDDHWTQFGPGAVGVGWDLSLLGLGIHISSGGDVVDLESANGWSASDEGKTFMRASAQAWADVHIAAGEKPDIARGMAERTAAFYTGA